MCNQDQNYGSKTSSDADAWLTNLGRSIGGNCPAPHRVSVVFIERALSVSTTLYEYYRIVGALPTRDKIKDEETHGETTRKFLYCTFEHTGTSTWETHGETKCPTRQKNATLPAARRGPLGMVKSRYISRHVVHSGACPKVIRCA